MLVVGSAQSGCQIAENLLAGGRRVVLATSPVGRVPFRHRGRDTVEWLAEAGFMGQRPGDLPDPSVMRAAMPIIAPGRGLSLPALARPASPWPGGWSGWTASGSPASCGAPVPGLWYLGLRWLTRRCSGLLLGFPGDAAAVADAVKAYLVA